MLVSLQSERLKEMLALGHEQERFWREQMQTDKAETKQRQGRDKAETRLDASPAFFFLLRS
jgi:hypothetical protein